VLGIISLLVGLLLPAVQSAREAARRVQCASNLKQIALAMHSYQSSTGTFPPGYVSLVLSSLQQTFPPGAGGPATGVAGDDVGPGWSGHTMILPYLEQKPLYDQINVNLAVDQPANATSIQTSLSVFHCPSDGQSQPLVGIPNTSANGAVLCTMATS